MPIQSHVSNPELVVADLLFVLIPVLKTLVFSLSGESKGSLFVVRQWEKLEAKSMYLDLGASYGRTQYRVVIRNEWVLVVFEDLLPENRVDNSLTRELLVVVAHLDGVETWVLNGDVSDGERVRTGHFGSVIISTESHYESTDAWLLQTSDIDTDVSAS